VFFKIQAIS